MSVVLIKVRRYCRTFAVGDKEQACCASVRRNVPVSGSCFACGCGARRVPDVASCLFGGELELRRNYVPIYHFRGCKTSSVIKVSYQVTSLRSIGTARSKAVYG
jgi:hypothetical protein